MFGIYDFGGLAGVKRFGSAILVKESCPRLGNSIKHRAPGTRFAGMVGDDGFIGIKDPETGQCIKAKPYSLR